MASLVLSLLAASDARAGSYSAPVYSGGTSNRSGTSYPDESNGSGGWGGASLIDINVKCSGAITATFTWVHGTGQTAQSDPPPKQVILVETGTAQANCNSDAGMPQASASCDDGLGGSETGTPVIFSDGSSLASSSRSDTKYSVVAGGASVTAAETPTATGFGESKGGVSNDRTSAYASYTASISPLTIRPKGTLTSSSGQPVLDSNGNQQILIGQGCGASLSGNFGGCTVSNYSWTVSGSTFSSWVGNNNSSAYTAYQNPNTAVPPGWYWYDLGPKPTPETVKCTATVTPSIEQGAAFPITVTQNVTVYVPGWTCTGTGGAVYINTEFGNGNGTNYYLYAGPAVDTVGRGMDWKATVSAPTGCPALGTGVLEMVQTETPSPTYTSAGVAYKRSNDGQQGLDSSYPYPFPFSAPSYASGDSPNFNLTSNSAASAQLTYSFVDTLMYEPPNSSQYVPLATFSWSTSGGAQLTGTKKWSDYGTNPVGAVTPSGITPFTASNAFPSWPKNVGNGTSTWVVAK